MPYLNRVQLMGHLGRDAEQRFTASGQSVVSFSIATTEKWKDKDGVQQEKTEWHRISAWGKAADSIVDRLTKGRGVYVEGRLETREWQDKEGQKRQTAEVNARTVVLLAPKEDRAQAHSADDSEAPF